MTASTLHLRARAPARPSRRRRLGADALAAMLVAGVAVGLLALCIALAAARPASRPAVAGRVAIVVDAAGRPGATLAAAERSRGRAGAAIRVPRSAFEAAADVRYFAAQRYGTVVVAGPFARAAARAVATEFPRTRFVLRTRVP